MLRLSSLVLVLGLAVSCGGGTDSETGKLPAAPETAAVHAVKCGCAVNDGKCSDGEFIEVDGKFVPLVGELGMGKMPFCKQDRKARAEGRVEGGKFVASSFSLIE